MPYPVAVKIRLASRGVFIWVLCQYILIKHRLCHILCKDEMHVTRLLVAVSSLTWGYILTRDSVLFTDARTTYSVMRVMLPENVWGILFTISGVAGFLSVIYNVRNRVTLVFDSLLGATLWTASTAACFSAHWPMEVQGWVNQWYAYPAPAAMSGEFWLSVAAWWHFVRHVADAPSCDTTYKKED